MPKFILELQIEVQDLEQFRRIGQKIVIAHGPPEDSSQLAWLAIDPFQANMVQWRGEYSLYAGQTRQGSVAVISVQATTEMPTLPGTAYALGKDGALTLTQRDLFPPAGSFRLFNEMQPVQGPNYTFGLNQAANANGTDSTGPIVAQEIPFRQQGDFSPDDYAYFVWLQTRVQAGDRVTVPPAVGVNPMAEAAVLSRSTQIEFGAGNSAVYRYIASMGGFALRGAGS